MSSKSTAQLYNTIIASPLASRGFAAIGLYSQIDSAVFELLGYRQIDTVYCFSIYIK